MFLKVNTESVKHEGGSDRIFKSGIYDLTLNHVEIADTTNGAVKANYYFDKVISYGNIILGTNKQPTFGYKILEALAVIAGEEELSDPEPTTVQFKNSSKELNCIPELNDIDVKAWVQFSYRMYKGDIIEDVRIKRFYRASDGAAGSEIIENENFGSRVQKDETVAHEIVYEDGVTAEAVAAWKEAKAQEASNSTPAPKAPTAKPRSSFPRPK
jgi:hypothetical protein